MAKAKKVLSTVLVALFTVFTVLSYVPAKAAAGPKINMVAQPNAEYKVGDRVIVKFNSAPYKGIVQYRAFLWKVGYGKVKELYPAYAKDSYFYKPVCVGTSTFTIDVFYATEPGVYEIVVGVKAKGAKAATAKYVNTGRFTVKAKEETTAEIKELVNPADVTVVQGEKANLPQTVKAKLADGTEKEVAVKWDTVDTTKVGEYTVNGTVEGTTLKAAVKVVVKAVALKVESVSAIKANVLQVKLSKAANTDDVNFAVTRGNAKVDVKSVEWNDSKTEATLTLTSKMVEGTHIVTLTSKSDTNFKATGSVEVKNQYAAQIKILDDVALTNDSVKKVYVYYDVVDQYGESIRNTTNIEWSVSAQLEKDDRVNGILTIVKDNGNGTFTYGDKIYITGVYTKTGLSGTKVVTVGQKQQVNTVEIAGFVKKGTNEIVKTLPVGFKPQTYYMVYTLKDQNGRPMQASALSSDSLSYVVDNVLLVKEIKYNSNTLVINGVEYNTATVEPGMSVDKGGEVNITVISNKTGEKVVKNIAVGENKIITTFTMSAPTDLIADGESVEIPFTALDQNGNEIKNFATIAKNKDFNKLVFTVSEGSLKLKEQNDGTAKLVYTDKEIGWDNPLSTDGIDRLVSLTSVVVGGNTSNQTIHIVDKARPEGIKAVNMDKVLVEGGSTTIDLSSFTFVDQYGREMETVDAENAADAANGFFAATILKGTEFEGYKFYVRATYKGDINYIESGFSKNNETQNYEAIIDSSNGTTIQAKMYVVKTAMSGLPVQFEIVKEKDSKVKVVSPKLSESLTVVDISQVKNFAIKDLNKVYVNTDKSNDLTGDTTTTTNSALELKFTNINTTATGITILPAYQQTVSVTGTYNGVSVKIPTVYLTANADKIIFDGMKFNGAKNLKWSDLYDATTARYTRKDTTDTIIVTINDKEKDEHDNPITEVLDTAIKTITISDAAPVVASIDVKPELTLAPNDTNITINATKLGCTVYDQYGVKVTDATVTFKVASIVENAEGYAANNFTLTNNASSTVTINGAERGDTFVVTITATKGGYKVTKDVKVTVGADEKAYINQLGNTDYQGLLDILEAQRKAGLN